MENITSKIPCEKRYTTKEEIDSMVAFLLNGKASPIAGQRIHIDGE